MSLSHVYLITDMSELLLRFQRCANERIINIIKDYKQASIEFFISKAVVN